MRSEEDHQKESNMAQWRLIESHVHEIKDALGLGIDEGVVEAVVAFQAYGFPTSQSCEGHPRESENGKHEGLPYPWIEIYVDEPEGWETNVTVQEAWRRENLMQQQRMVSLLTEFYASRQADYYGEQLTLSGIGAYGGFRVQSFAAELMELHGQEEIELKHKLYLAELNAFADFLKKKFLL